MNLVSYSYLVYGLKVESSSRIEALQSTLSDSPEIDLYFEDGPEPEWASTLLTLPVEIVRRRMEPVGAADPSVLLKRLGEEQGFELCYSDGVRFVTDGNATRVWGSRPPGMASEELMLYLLGPVMGFVLRRRKIPCLHASAIEFQDHAICLCGEAGFGKSTTAAALALRGLGVIAEDIVALEEVHGVFLAVPGYPRVCLWPESVQMLLGREDALPLIMQGWEKRYLTLEGQPARFAARKAPASIVYLIAPRTREGTAPRIENISGREAVLELVRNTYMNWALGREQRAAEFDTLCRLVERVEVRRLVPHAEPGKIRELCDVILADAEAVLSRQKSSSASMHR